jgi:ribosome biogenesis protein Nip4
MDFKGFCALFGEYLPEAHVVGERYYLVNEEVAQFKSGEQRKPHAMGVYLGMGRRQFTPTPALLRVLAAHTDRKAFLKDDRAEWLFICGRDIFPDFYTTDIKEGFVLVQNKHDENMGLAKIAKGKEGIILKNILDRGNYLRHEKVCVDC